MPSKVSFLESRKELNKSNEQSVQAQYRSNTPYTPQTKKQSKNTENTTYQSTPQFTKHKQNDVRPNTGYSSKSQFTEKFVKTLGENGFKDNTTNIDDIPESVKSEFDREFCNYISGTCTCGKCKWPHSSKQVQFPYNISTIYQKDYPWRTPEKQTKPFFNGQESSLMNKGNSGDFNTTHRKDFQTPHTHDKLEKFRPKDNLKSTKNAPFEQRTQYEDNYLNWSAGFKPESMKPTKFAATTDLPFQAKTTYGEAFSKNQDSNTIKARDTNKPNTHQSSSLFSNAPFFGTTTYNQTFQNFKSAPQQREMYQDDENIPIPTLPGQFKTEKATAYDWKQPKKCVAREIIQNLSKTSKRARDVLSTLKQ